MFRTAHFVLAIGLVLPSIAVAQTPAAPIYRDGSDTLDRKLANMVAAKRLTPFCRREAAALTFKDGGRTWSARFARCACGAARHLSRPEMSGDM